MTSWKRRKLCWFIVHVAGPKTRQVYLLFPIPRFPRRLLVAGILQNTNVVFSKRREPATRGVSWVPFCVERVCIPPIR
jgi:hypothetical protein